MRILWLKLSLEISAGFPGTLGMCVSRVKQCCEFGCQTSNFGNWQSGSATGKFFLATGIFSGNYQFSKEPMYKDFNDWKKRDFNLFFATISWGMPPKPPLGRGIPTHTFHHRCTTQISATGYASCQKNFTHLATANIRFRNTVKHTRLYLGLLAVRHAVPWLRRV